ncbi:L-galactose dehydrogenase [Gamsiella multidivaricata]|uniref:L-galactose dehydrogenase n=1 Tax=Gamsiella multidivaricata TaxID=101098 RepID=UPI00221FD801|nr:L-galactose dehydrogenase [Gamsiella multidivaricata]KAI7829357.1 L-galactose dehydrogenase [Gamsiella multidivaricata]
MDVSPIIYGTSAFAQLYNPIKAHWPAEACKRAIDLGINTFDTSPYYGNSEQVLGKALLSISATHPRSTYYLSTKVGRYGLKKKEFNYSKERVRASVEESMDRMHTNYLDIVYAHDVEFVSVDEAVEAVGELFRLKAEGKIKYVGISGYPLPYLLALIPVLHERVGQTLDILMTYCHYNLHNTLLQDYIAHFRDLGISTIWSASPVSMGLLRSNIPVPEWHPAPAPLLSAAQDCIKIVEDQSPGKDLAEIAVKFAMKWRGCEGLVVGMSNAEEVEKNVAWWKDVQEDGARDEVQERCEAALRRRLQAFEKLEWASPPIDDC